MPGWDLVVWFGRSHFERSHLHPESSSKSSLQPKSQHYPILVHLRLSRPFRGPGKNSEIPTAGTPTRARVSGCLGRGLTPQFPWGSYERGRDAGREGSLKRKNTPLARRCPVSTATGHNRANARIGWGPGLGLLPLLKGSQPLAFPSSPGDLARWALLRAQAAPASARCEERRRVELPGMRPPSREAQGKHDMPTCWRPFRRQSPGASAGCSAGLRGASFLLCLAESFCSTSLRSWDICTGHTRPEEQSNGPLGELKGIQAPEDTLRRCFLSQSLGRSYFRSYICQEVFRLCPPLIQIRSLSFVLPASLSSLSTLTPWLEVLLAHLHSLP
ncbi:uncharacterized protein [Castor canadensis]|uniref:Uncharacterized protein n=1 Tax=Castor canadensis TaxID=51338 RepID=A0AC58K9Z9_CASCN